MACQGADKVRLGSEWVDSGLLFTQPDGSPLHPADVTERFYEIVRQAGLPPIRLHDLRHGAATLALAAGADMKVVQAMLRHSSITVTAEATAKLIPRNSTRQLGLVSGADQTTMDSKEVEEMHPHNTKPHVIEIENVGLESAPSGTRTPNPLVKSRHLGVSDGVE
ncbi:tyrosine-type recombinase/integrase [Amycolatopsis sp. WAC 01376]|uniref:tyrosine-type recombinase/integrase n=1 Tax=Amycolatopsis sp. WAC 01376 TaxID=2203195 RepID=UPI001F355146